MRLALLLLLVIVAAVWLDTTECTLTPILECSHNYGNGTCETFYGYLNSGHTDVMRPVSASNTSSNYFFPAPYNRGQPTTFEHGEQRLVFAVVWPCSSDTDSLAWTLDQTVVVTALVETCPLGCDQVPYSYATYDACGVCDGDNSACDGVAQASSIQSNGYCAHDHQPGHSHCDEDDDDCTPSPPPGDNDDDDDGNCGQDNPSSSRAPWGSNSQDDDSFQGGGGGIKHNCTKAPKPSHSAHPSSDPSHSAHPSPDPSHSAAPSSSSSHTMAPSVSSSRSSTSSATLSQSSSTSASTSRTPSNSGTGTSSGTPSSSHSHTPSGSVPPSCEHGASTTSTHTGSETASVSPSASGSTTSTTSQSETLTLTSSPSASPSPSASATETAAPSPSNTETPTPSNTASQTPSRSHSATPVPSPVPSGSCPPLSVNISVDVVDNVTVVMLPCEHPEVKRRQRSVQCEPPSHNEPGCCMPVIEFCYSATTDAEWSSLILDFAPVADDIDSCLLDEPQSHCRVRLPPQYTCGFQSICVFFTLEELLLNCTLDDDAHTPTLIITPGSQPGQTFYNGTLYVGVALNWPQIQDPDIRNDFPTCNDTGVVIRHSAHPFGVEVDASGTNVACYEIASPKIEAYVCGVWWMPDGEVHLKLTTRLELLGEDGDDDSDDPGSWLQNARVYLPLLEGVEFDFVDTFVPCDPSAPDADTVCTQHWLLESVGGVDDQDFGGLKPLLFDVFVVGLGVIRVAHVDLHLSLHRYYHIEQMTQDLSATLVLSRDRDFDQVFVQPPDDEPSWPFFHDCDMICGKLALCLSDDWGSYFDMVVDRVQICTCPDEMLVLPFDPNDPDHTGCNTPDLPGLVNVVIYDRESNYSNADFNFSFVSDPPTLQSDEEAFCWFTKNIGSMRYLLQVRWYADGHPAPQDQQQQQQRKRGLLTDGRQAERGLLFDGDNSSPLATSHGSASNVFTVGCDEHIHIFVPGHGCRDKDKCCDNDSSSSFWRTWFWVIVAAVLCFLVGLLFVGAFAGCCHEHHEYPLLVQELQQNPVHHHHHHHSSNNVQQQQWGIVMQSGHDNSSGQNQTEPLLGGDLAPRRHHKPSSVHHHS